MNQITAEAIILKRLNFGEADRILTVLTLDRGKVSILAKGVRRSKSKLAGGLELFSVTDIVYIEGKSDLKTVVSTRLKKHFRNIVKNVDRTMAGYDFMKVIDEFTQHSSESQYYDLLRTGLTYLDDISIDLSVSQVWFYTHLLQIHGSNINVEKPLNAKTFSEDESYNFSYDDMSFLSSPAGQFSPNHIKLLRICALASNPKKLTTIHNHEVLSGDLAKILQQTAMMNKA